ncbi:TasA family protein [Bacillaceae bacterium CLA-AA-H227]|uniref:TasA family protein n=1 Tax=Robertmurraya yapensis (ex Hitch et al 2024) TaxID=3133160 RepID=A0ACC6SD51_9BACI
MNVKKRIGLSLASAALGLSLLAGGTYSYFSDTAEASGSFVAGTLDLAVDPEVVINVDGIKPGDWMNRVFYLDNLGSIDISEVVLNTSYTVNDANGNNTDDFGKHIRVNFLENVDKQSPFEYNDIVYSTTLYDLQNLTPDLVELRVLEGFEQSGLEAGTSDLMFVQFEFVDNNEDQNQFQGDSLNLTLSLEAQQGEGEHKE